MLLQLSLSKNSIGVYQLCKMLSVPTAAAVSRIWFGRIYSVPILVSLVCMTLGIYVSLNARTALELSTTGLNIALIAAFTMSGSQNLSSEIQKDTKLDSVSIMVYTKPLQVIGFFLISFFLEPLDEIWKYNWSWSNCYMLLGTTILSLLLSFAQLLILGKFSAVTFAVLGHVKTAFILASGVMFFGDTLSIQGFLGLLMVFGSMIAYNVFE